MLAPILTHISSPFSHPPLLDCANANPRITCHPPWHFLSVYNALLDELPDSGKDMRTLEAEVNIWCPRFFANLSLAISFRKWILHAYV